MSTLIHMLRSLLQKVAPVQDEVEITPSTQAQFGHYQCNSALKWSKLLKRSPRDIAYQMVEQLDQSLFEKIEIAGPGFINITFSKAFLSEQLQKQLEDPYCGVERPKEVQHIIVDFSSPNIAKEMHVGHLRSTIIGDCLARLFEFMGHRVLRLNHVGDWGTSFGMLIAFMQEEGKEQGDLQTLMDWYRAAKERFDHDDNFKTKAREAVVHLQAGDPRSLRLWDVICAISRVAFEEVYDLLDVKLIERGESFYNPLLPDMIVDLENRGLITISEGAKCLFHEGYDLPYMVQKSDGGYNYDTTDLAAMRHRIEQEGADRIIIVTDAGQSIHFQLLKLSAERAGYLRGVRFDHVPFGVVLGADGKKFRTRSGEVTRLIDLLHKAQEEAEAILRERNSALNEGELKHMASILGIDAVKYADLSCHRLSDYLFSYERMLRFEGNTAAFILYSYVRIKGIRRKIKGEIKQATINLVHPSEVELGVHVLQFAEVLQVLSESLLPHILTDYLYQLAGKFNSFFRDCRVEGSPEQGSRLALCEATEHVMAQSLKILGLKTLEFM